MKYQEIKDALEAGELDKALAALVIAGKENYYENDTFLLKARYSRMMKNFNKGISDPRDMQIETNRICEAGKDLLEKVARERKKKGQIVIIHQIKPQETMSYQNWRNKLEKIIKKMRFNKDPEAKELVNAAIPLNEKIIAFSHQKDRNLNHDIRGEEEKKLRVEFDALMEKNEMFINRYNRIQRAAILDKAIACVGAEDLKKSFTPVMQDLIGLYPTEFNKEMETFNNLENGPGMESFAGRITSMLEMMQ